MLRSCYVYLCVPPLTNARTRQVHHVNLEERDDEQLMALIVQQSMEAPEKLYDRYSWAVFLLAMSLLRDAGAAEEVTQDVF